MNTRAHNRVASAAALILGSASIPAAWAQTCFDLTRDWSDAQNPNGVWSYNERTNPLPHVAAWDIDWSEWTGPQPAWADSENGSDRAPAWFKLSAGTVNPHDWQIGDVITHSQEPLAGQGNGVGNVTWTSPFGNVVNISGACWRVRDGDRSQDWNLYHNDMLLTGGRLYSGDPYSRANPFRFSDGSGGPAVLNGRAVAPGDVIKLEIVRNPQSQYGDLIGVVLTLACVCPGNLDGDGDVDLSDLTILLADFGCTGGGCLGDLEDDGETDLQDLTILLSNFGSPCP